MKLMLLVFLLWLLFCVSLHFLKLLANFGQKVPIENINFKINLYELLMQ